MSCSIQTYDDVEKSVSEDDYDASLEEEERQ